MSRLSWCNGLKRKNTRASELGYYVFGSLLMTGTVWPIALAVIRIMPLPKCYSTLLLVTGQVPLFFDYPIFANSLISFLIANIVPYEHASILRDTLAMNKTRS